ncbi:MAG: lysophospholipase [Alphaproteobacteria bacterium]|nr:lysophospholipase [Alphaproteobacteria bacterium]
MIVATSGANEMADSAAQTQAQAWDFGRGLRGYKWPASAARANLLLTHGFAEYAERYVEHYHRLIPHLNGLGFDVYGFDLQGHGRSPGARGIADLKKSIADHQAARRALSADGKPLFLFGHSLGGLITAASVAEDGKGVAGVILSAPALLIEAPPHLRAIANIFAVLSPGLRLLPASDASAISRIDAEVQAYKTDPMISALSIPAKVGATAIAAAEKAWTRYPQWTTPVLVLHGEKDTLTDPNGSKRFFELIAAKDKRLELYPEGRHELLNDLDRDAAWGAIADWLPMRVAT